MIDIATVIEGMKRKDKKSFQLMVNHFAPRLMTVAKFYAKNTQDAEDILQDAFVRIFLNIKKFDSTNEKVYYAWAKTIVVNTALSKYRRKYFSYEKYDSTMVETLEEPSINLKHDEDEILQYIYSLPLKYRNIIGLYALEGYSHAEIADMLQIKESSSRSAYSRAKTKLKKIMSLSKLIIY